MHACMLCRFDENTSTFELYAKDFGFLVQYLLIKKRKKEGLAITVHEIDSLMMWGLSNGSHFYLFGTKS